MPSFRNLAVFITAALALSASAAPLTPPAGVDPSAITNAVTNAAGGLNILPRGGAPGQLRRRGEPTQDARILAIVNILNNLLQNLKISDVKVTGVSLHRRGGVEQAAGLVSVTNTANNIAQNVDVHNVGVTVAQL
ncbi:hypothetical protein H0H93_006361 [Arthromyces matolae]|nr:hypothetical protein H0H93_006361 [Arthromyces matolae]